MRVLAIVIASLLLLQSFHHVACSRRDQGNAKRPPCTKTLCTNNDQCNDPPCTRCSSNPWGSGTCWY
uniref:Putative secreted salivary protein n=1 Tax=Ixodes scapularis TaxID=6945 RepID=Q4PMN6_IXOSC|nr:putative secreted salivary protein [Ixodes scapularis]